MSVVLIVKCKSKELSKMLEDIKNATAGTVTLNELEKSL